MTALLLMLALSLQAGPQRPEAVIQELEARLAGGAPGPYEVVQSTITARDTYRINKSTGEVWILTGKPDGAFTWQAIPRATTIAGPFSLSLSPLVAKGTFLVNERTGATWILMSDADGKLSWVAIL